MPPPPVGDFVRRIWALDLDGTDAGPERIVPDGCCEIVLTLQGEVRGSFPGRAAPDGLVRRPADILVGQATGAVVVQPLGPVRLLGIRLRTAGAAALLGFPAAECTDRIVDLADAAPGLRSSLRAAVDGIREPDAAIAAVAAALRRFVAGRTPPAVEISSVVGAIRALRPGLTVHGLARGLQWSERRLQRAFAADVGIPPKLLHRITRVQRALALAGARPDDTWAAIAARAGYADQPHLVRDFAELAGCRPSSIRADPAPLRDRMIRYD